ncbi:fungal-specific transcription factor domain-containing protein [Ephemerocybe angulata]|uniref:Fungal-specific transcription factor domain-containing protein n=1 Tax=Ephemerocybe angulata TaxID=980116 RepID=A0A8H6I9Q7_9AGAR|nr:fungal-specific transcription factor domain-containing protein [Tulosesus angulatus]
MAYGTYPSPSDSHSPSTSTSGSPETMHATLDPMPLIDDDTSGQSSSGTPTRSTTGLPRSQHAGKGGCWTCRVRRKKCDEQREGDSCKTCRRLTIKCLGWGAKRPDWMRDKKNVDAYKASIKAQLSRAGLIRQAAPPSLSPSTPPVTITHSEFQTYSQFTDPPYVQNENNLMSGMPGALNPSFDQLSTNSFNDLNLHPFDQGLVYPYSPASMSSGSSFGMVDPIIDPSFGLFAQGDMLSFQEPQANINTYGGLGQSPMYNDLVTHYFDVTSKLQFVFCGSQLSQITYNTIMQDSRGAPCYAVYALADLHLTQMRISQGLEAPQSGQASTAHYMYQEALFKLKSNRDNGNGWSESDAIAALHLVSYSHLSGGSADWQEPFEILCAWLLQSNLSLSGENSRNILQSMSIATQLLVKLIMVLVGHLLELVLHATSEVPELVEAAPDDALLTIADISALAQWKATQVRNGTLSYPELVKRGLKIQDTILKNKATEPDFGNIPLLQEGETPSDIHRNASVSIFRESAYLYLHTILSNSTPGVAEISSSVDAIVRKLDQIQPSNLDRALVFPICLAGCMTNDSNKRDYLKGRLQGLNETYGNLLQTRLLMEALWQRRDVSQESVDVREIMRDQQLMVLLL